MSSMLARVPMSHELPPDLQSLILSYLTPQQLLSTCSHLSHSITHSALTLACFRTHLLLDSRAINALPTLTSAAFHCLSQAASLTVEYGDSADESCCRDLFSFASPHSLLHFTHLHSLSLRYTDTWDFLNSATPYEQLVHLLSDGRHCRAGSRSQPLPHLTHLTVHGIPHYDDSENPYRPDMLRPLVALQSLTHLQLHFPSLISLQLRPLLQLPHLQAVVFYGDWERHAREQHPAEATVLDELQTKGVQFINKACLTIV